MERFFVAQFRYFRGSMPNVGIELMNAILEGQDRDRPRLDRLGARKIETGDRYQ